MEILWKRLVSAEFWVIRNCAFPQNFYTKTLGEITVFFVVTSVLEFENVWKSLIGKKGDPPKVR